MTKYAFKRNENYLLKKKKNHIVILSFLLSPRLFVVSFAIRWGRIVLAQEDLLKDSNCFDIEFRSKLVLSYIR